jgi:hypothetical protein
VAIRTSSQTGNTSNSPFAFGTAVNTGDQLIVSTGHTVTRDAALDLGTSPPQTPITIPTISLTTATTTTSLPTGIYLIRYVYVDAGGNESHPFISISTGTITNGSSKPRITLPALPSGISSISLYATAAGGAAGTETLYASGITGTTYDMLSASWTNGTTSQAAAAPVPNKAALQINGGGAWVEGHASTLTCRGDLFVGATGGVSSYTGNAGGTLEFDPSSATSPANAAYRLVWGNYNNFGSNFSKILTSGTSSGSRYTIQTKSGSNGKAYITPGILAFGVGVDTAYLDVSWLDLTRVGTSSVNAMVTAPSSIAMTFKYQGGRWDTCGTLSPGNPPTNSTVRIRNITTVSTVGLVAAVLCPLNLSGTSAIGSGERHIGGCCFDERVLFTAQRDYTVGEIVEGDGWGNVFYKGCSIIGSAAAAMSRGNLMRLPTTSDEQPIMSATTALNYYLCDTATLNPHFLGGGFAATTHAIDRCAFEYTGADDNGDCILHLLAAVTYNLTNNVVTLNGNGDGASGTLLTMGADLASQTVNLLHNTVPSALQAGAQVGEGSPQPHAGMLGAFKSNLIYRIPGATGPTTNTLGPRKLSNSGGYSDATMGASGLDIVASTDADYNCGAGVSDNTGTYGVNGYFLRESSPCGSHDVALADAAAVGFIDYTRRLAEWDVSLGGSGTRAQKNAHALAELMKRNDAAGYNTAYTVSALRTYVFGGVAPTNSALRNAGSDGVTIGAVEGVWVSSRMALTGVGG